MVVSPHGWHDAAKVQQATLNHNRPALPGSRGFSPGLGLCYFEFWEGAYWQNINFHAVLFATSKLFYIASIYNYATRLLLLAEESKNVRHQVQTARYNHGPFIGSPRCPGYSTRDVRAKRFNAGNAWHRPDLGS